MTESNNENVEPTPARKKVDEDWKKQVEREKVRETAKESQQQQQQQPRGVPPDPGSFTAFITGLTMQAMMAMGEMADPNTGMQRENLAEAQYLIDTLAMLQQKTRGNLNEQEAAAMEEAVYSLRMAYVRKTSGPQAGPQGNQK
jgi:hypothetical protein